MLTRLTTSISSESQKYRKMNYIELKAKPANGQNMSPGGVGTWLVFERR